MSYARHGKDHRRKWGDSKDLAEWFRAIRLAVKKHRNANRRRVTRER